MSGTLVSTSSSIKAGGGILVPARDAHGRIRIKVFRDVLPKAIPGSRINKKPLQPPASWALGLLGSWGAVRSLGSQAPLSKDPRVARVGLSCPLLTET